MRDLVSAFIVVCLIWLAVYLFALLMMSVMPRDDRLRRGQCPKCGYDLKGRLRLGCPECGWRREPAS